MRTNTLTVRIVTDCDDAAAPYELQLPNSVGDLITELQEFPARADSDDRQRDVVLLLCLDSAYPSGLTEEQMRELEELDREAESQMEFWQNRCDFFEVMRERVEVQQVEQLDHVDSESTEATVA